MVTENLQPRFLHSYTIIYAIGDMGWVKNIYVRKGFVILFFFVVYTLTARFGLSFDAVSGFAALLWIPSGISLAFLFFFGYDMWPAILLSSFVVNFMLGANALIALGIGFGNTLEAVIGVYILKKTNFNPSLQTVKDVLLLTVLAAPISAALSATVGVSMLLAGKIATLSTYLPTWRAWFIGDAISFVIVASLIFVWKKKLSFSIERKRLGELILFILVMILSAMIVFGGLFGIFPSGFPITFLVFPPLLWVSLRFGQKITITTVFLLSLFAALQTLHGLGPFAIGRISGRLLLLQSFIGIIGVTSMIVTAIEAERRKLDARKDEFISLVSHELKTPLTSLKLFNQMLQTLFVERKFTKELVYLEKMDKQLNHLQMLIDDLLDMSKVQRGKLEYHEKYFSLVKVVTETVKDMQAITPSHTILLKTAVLEKDDTVFADQDRVYQVLINLLTNAKKYSPNARKIHITIASINNDIVVSIKDSGIGITEDAQEKIFQRYYRAHDRANSTIPGLGIGLYISSEIIKRSGGKMWLKSKEGKGSTFSFSLPISRPSIFFF